MVSLKFLFVTSIIAVSIVNTSAGILDHVFPTVLSEHWKSVPYENGYSFSLKDPNGSEREEKGFIMNPGTDHEELVVMGTYNQIDEKSGSETITMYVADKDGYRPMLKIRKLSAGALKSSVGG